MSESKTLILIDGHALAFRQYFALERTNMKTKDGTPTWAVYGFFKAIFDLLKNENLKPDAIAVAFDVSHVTFRTEEYTEYKANREKMPDEMQIQMGLIYEGLKSFNIPIYTKEGFEADDVIGTISRLACELGHKVYILTGDQDSFQLIRQNGCVKVIIPSKGELIEYDWNKVHDKLGVYPNQVIDYKALRGDTSDNIPGVKGIGEKTAVKLLEEYKTVDNVLANIENISGKSVKEKLSNGIESAKMSKYLATIVQDVDINFDFENTKIEIPDVSKITDFLRNMQFYSFLKNIEFILKSFDKNTKTPMQDKEITLQDSNGGQLGLFAQAVQNEVNKIDLEYDFTWIDNIDTLKNIINTLENEETICVKSFYQMKNCVNVDIYGLLLGYKLNNKTNAFYVPLNNPLFTIDFLKILKEFFESYKNNIVTHDTKNEANVFKYLNLELNNITFDTMLASYIKNSNANSSFDIQCMERINHILPTIVSDNKQINFDNNETSEKYFGEYCAAIFELTKYWQNNLDKDELKILTEIEIPLAFVLSNMERNGVSIDVDYLKNLSTEFNDKMKVLENKIYDIAGEQFNINSPKQVGQILFEKLQLKSSKKRGKAKNSTSAEVLNELAQEYEIAKFILEYRKYAKLNSTYTESLPTLVDTSDNRIHTTFNQVTTATGRLSSSNPNLQNIPIRTEEGNKIRKAIVPSDKNSQLILSADYSQIELRLLAHVSEDENLINAFKSGIDVHTLTASKVFDVPVEDVTKEMRYKAKAVNFGIVYGQSKYGLAKSLKITNDEAETFINKYFDAYPKLQVYMQNMIILVEKQGFVETIFGRKRYLESEINSSNGMIREFAKRAAINHPMQGSASDLIKLAMVNFQKALESNNLKSKLIVQVHDELLVEVEKSELETVKQIVLESMELNQPLRVPLLVDINIGESWKES